MGDTNREKALEALGGFQIFGEAVDVAPYGTGHINETFRATFDQAGTPVRYTLQRINTSIFKDAAALMENVRRVTEHSRARLAGAPDATRRALTLVPALDGGYLHTDGDGNAWRCYLFIEKTHTVDLVDSEKSAYEAARAFARFQGLLADMPGGRLNETIPDFHNTPKRYAAFHAALEADALGRAAGATPEIDFVLSQEGIAGSLVEMMASGAMPERPTHNDTKINNVLLDDATGEGICVIDLDTLMPGSALYDFGDMVRSATINVEEDSPDWRGVVCRPEIFKALADGFCAGGFLTEAEKGNLALGGALMTLECGVRFLTDYLEGDHYFRIHRPAHNLDRCRTQFALVRSILAQRDELQGYVEGRK
ncbi:MAG: phosphotransferase [Kiritimatiellae bacterium]|nr:phosphotransferase [Kiritimatiellia bacterium]